MLLCIEVMFFAVSLNFIFISMYIFSTAGQTMCLFIITVAAAETAIGLSLLIILLRLGNKITYQNLITLRN
jgi:NADH-quinone oxidoreductase subunit K